MDYSGTRTSNNKTRAFSIIELLVVIAVIGVLAGIFFGVAGGVRERSQISRAESDLNLLAQYLEQYKAHYGDYPWVNRSDFNTPATDSSTERAGEKGIVALYDSLNGLRSVDGTSTFGSGPTNPRQRAFVDRSKFNHEFAPSLSPPMNPANPEEHSVALIDPWGQAYRYYYDKGATSWENPSYVLYSVGPDGEHELPDNRGYADRSDPKNLDNIYAK